MNYIFNVLWFEDNAGWYRLQKPKLEAIVAEHCLQCNTTQKRSPSFGVEELEATNYDLILMDYDLASKINGAHVIGAIRDANVLTDILFYSSQYEAMISAVASISPPLDGIYYSSRKIEEFHQKLSRVISKIVQRSEDLINLRGFVLDNTCDFELRIREVLTICWNKFLPEQKDQLSKKIMEQLDGKCGRMKAQVEKAKQQPCVFSYANNDDYILSVADRLDMLEVILPILISEYSMPSSEELLHFKDYYITKVNMYRNRLGHVKLGEQVLHIQGQDVPIDQALHRLLRKNISEVEKTLLSIEKYIVSQM